MKKIRFIDFKKNDFILVTISTVACSFISFLYSVLAKKYVSPLEYGIYSTCLLLQTYLNYAQLGVMSAFNRDYPRLMGEQKEKEANILRNTTASYIWGIFTIIGVVGTIFLVSIYCGKKIETEYFIGYIIVLWLLIIDNTANFCMYTTRIRGGYNYSAFVSLAKTIISLVAGLVAILKWGYYGLYVMPACASLVSIFMYWKYAMANFEIEINWTVLKISIRTGLPLMVNSFIWTIMQSIDKFVILAFMDTEALGIYSVPLLGFSTMVLIPQTISQVFYNKISILYGKTGDKLLLVQKCMSYTCIIGLATAFVAVVAYYILPIFVEVVMPNYVDGTYPAQVLIIGVAIYSTTMLYSNIFSVLKYNRDLLINSIVVCIFNIIFSVMFVVVQGREIGNVAVGTSFSYVVYSLVLLIRISYKFKVELWGLFKASWIPVIVIMIPALILYYVIPEIYIAFAISIVWGIVISWFYIRNYKKNGA